MIVLFAVIDAAIWAFIAWFLGASWPVVGGVFVIASATMACAIWRMCKKRVFRQ